MAEAKHIHANRASSADSGLNDDKSLSRAKRLTFVLIAVGIVVAVVVSVFFIRQMTAVVDDSTTSNMSEIAEHDIYLIDTYLNQNLDNLLHAGNKIRLNKLQSLERVQELLNLERTESDFDRMFLMDSEGNLYTDTSLVSPPEKNLFLDLFKDGKDRVVERMDKVGRHAAEGVQMLVYGVQLRPYTVDGITFTAIIGANDINSIQDRLKINNFNGQGFASLIDRTGDYIINVDDKAAVINTSNFFNDLEAGRLQDISFEEVKNAVENEQPLTFVWTDPEGMDMVSMLKPLPEVGWVFEMSVPEAAFAEKSQQLVFMTVAVIVVVLVIMLIVFLVASRWSKKTTVAQARAQSRSEFLSSLSHEIRTPLNGLVGLNRLMQGHLQDPDQMREYVDKASVTTQYLLSLLNDVLDMSKLESGKFDIEKRPMNIESVIDIVCTMQRETFNNRGVNLVTDLNIEYPWIFADELHLKQVIMNIMGNASKFTPEGGTVTVRVRQSQEESGEVTTVFEIEDTGIGMTQDFLNTIFDPFSQERTRSNESQKGTGLGMSISHLLMVQMGGRIDVTSELNVGSCFSVVLPAEIVPADHPEIALQEAMKADGGFKLTKELNILLVEDNALNSMIMGEILEEQNCVVEYAENGVEAIEKFEASGLNQFDVIIMDLQMPRMNGFDATKGIRASDREDAQSVVIFACSADQAKEDKEHAAAVGMNGFISKPVDFDEMLKLLQSVKANS